MNPNDQAPGTDTPVSVTTGSIGEPRTIDPAAAAAPSPVVPGSLYPQTGLPYVAHTSASSSFDPTGSGAPVRQTEATPGTDDHAPAPPVTPLDPAGTHPQAVLGAALPTTADVPAPAPAPATMADLGTDHPEVQKLDTDFMGALGRAAGIIRDGIDKLLTEGEKDIPVLDADLVPAGVALVEAKTSPRVGNWIKSLFGMGGSQVSQPLSTALDATLLHGVALLRSDLEKV